MKDHDAPAVIHPPIICHVNIRSPEAARVLRAYRSKLTEETGAPSTLALAVEALLLSHPFAQTVPPMEMGA